MIKKILTVLMFIIMIHIVAAGEWKDNSYEIDFESLTGKRLQDINWINTTALIDLEQNKTQCGYDYKCSDTGEGSTYDPCFNSVGGTITTSTTYKYTGHKSINVKESAGGATLRYDPADTDKEFIMVAWMLDYFPPAVISEYFEAKAFPSSAGNRIVMGITSSSYWQYYDGSAQNTIEPHEDNPNVWKWVKLDPTTGLAHVQDNNSFASHYRGDVSDYTNKIGFNGGGNDDDYYVDHIFIWDASDSTNATKNNFELFEIDTPITFGSVTFEYHGEDMKLNFSCDSGATWTQITSNESTENCDSEATSDVLLLRYIHDSGTAFMKYGNVTVAAGAPPASEDNNHTVGFNLFLNDTEDNIQALIGDTFYVYYYENTSIPYNLTRNGTTITNNSLQSLDVGYYNFTISVNDTTKTNFNSVTYHARIVNYTWNASLQLDMIYPLQNINVSQNELFNITLNVTCRGQPCYTVNVSLDPYPNNIERKCYPNILDNRNAKDKNNKMIVYMKNIYTDENCTSFNDTGSVKNSQYSKHYPIIIKQDKLYPLKKEDILDYNASYISIRFKQDKAALNTQIPIKSYKIEKSYNQLSKEFEEEYIKVYEDSITFKSLSQDIYKLIPFGKDVVLHYGNTSTQVRYNISSGSGWIRKYGAPTTWDAVHDATSGTDVGKDSEAYIKVAEDTGANDYRIRRTFFPFNISIDLNGNQYFNCTNASIYFTPFSHNSDSNNESEWFAFIGNTTQANFNDLVTDDFNQCGPVDNPTLFSEKIYFSTLTDNAYHNISVNYNGTQSITYHVNNNLVVPFGARQAFDIIDQQVGDGWKYEANIGGGAHATNPTYIVIDYDLIDNSSNKTGLVSNVVGDNPFFTNVTNPLNITLLGNESQIITFFVNATGTINSTHEFYAFANITNKLYINNISNFWNVTIIEFVEDEEPAEDSCDCPDSADWLIDCSDNCIISENCDMQGNDIYTYGSGTVTVTAQIYNFGYLYYGCNSPLICRSNSLCLA